MAVQCSNVMSCDYEANSFDIVFSNWLLMYLSNSDAKTLIQKILTWLTPNGKLFFRESCFGQSGDRKRKTNPTNYRWRCFCRSYSYPLYSGISSEMQPS